MTAKPNPPADSVARYRGEDWTPMTDQHAESVGDPVQVHEAWIATCDSCGWHTQPVSPKYVAGEWARLHRVTCPLKTGGRTDV